MQDASGHLKASKRLCWIHSDIMDDNIFMELCPAKQNQNGLLTKPIENGNSKTNGIDEPSESWRPSYIIDFSNLSVGQ